MKPIHAWWASLDVIARSRWHALALCGALCMVHYALLSPWFVEDAAITFSFSRHLAGGEGFVAWPGGERVQGFSNPTWTLLLAVTDLLGVNPYVAAKLYGALFALLTLPLAYRWARLLVPGSRLLPALAPLLLAVSPQFVVWAGSGLENGLMNLLVAASVVWMLESRGRGAWPAIPLGLLAITRPEAPLYVAVICVLGGCFALARRVPSALDWIARIVALAALPWTLWMGFCWWYFAWPLPNTYYAKLHESNRVQPWAWDGHGWNYVRWWALRSTYGFFVPLAGVLHAGVHGRRGLVGIGLGVVLALLLVSGAGWIPWPEGPVWVGQGRVLLVGVILGLVPVLGIGREGDEPRVLAWTLACVAVFFPVYGGGSDWMEGYRWLSPAQVPLTVLVTDLVGQGLKVAARLGRASARDRRLVVGIVAGPVLSASVVNTVDLLGSISTSPYDVRERVRYMAEVRRRLHLDHVVAMEVDMGAQMWWGDYELVDMAGLVDVPMGHHRWEKKFVAEYVFQEVRPDFAHAHAGWAQTVGIAKHPAWFREYLEIPGYPVSRGNLHVGNFIRRDLFLQPRWTGDTRRATRFFEDVALVGLEIPAPEVAAGQSLYVSLGWTSGNLHRGEIRPLLFLSGQGRLVVRELPMGYDWWGERGWRAHEVITGRHTLSLPDDLPPGTYDLGLLLVKAQDRVLAARQPAKDPVLGNGEVRFEGAIEVLPYADVVARVDALVDEALDALGDGRCADADDLVERARRHLDPDHRDQPRSRGAVVEGFAACWARFAEDASSNTQAESAIRTARRWNHRNRTVIRVGSALADRWEAAGEVALEEGDHDDAYAQWRRALVADPGRAWLRRKAEEIRDIRLGIRRG